MNVLIRNLFYAVGSVVLVALFVFVAFTPVYIVLRPEESQFTDLVVLFQNPVAWWISVTLILVMTLILVAVECLVPEEKWPGVKRRCGN